MTDRRGLDRNGGRDADVPRSKARAGSVNQKEPKRERKSSRNAAAVEVSAPVTGGAPVQLAATTANGARTVPRRPATRHRGGGSTGDRKVRPVLKLLSGLLTLAVVVLLGVGGTIYYMQAAIDAAGPLTEAKLLVVPQNTGTQDIAETLEKDGIVADRHIFLAGLYTLRVASIAPGGRVYSLKAGKYEIKPGASIRSVVETLSEGRSILVKITIPEGLTSYEIVQRLKANGNLSGSVREIPGEGTLLPETYSVPTGSPVQTILDMMQAAQKKLMDQLWAERQEGLPLKTAADAITLASIVEKETGRNDERDRVAGVFINRLRRNMKLQSDPTILYGLQFGKVQWGKTIYLSDKNSRTAHNTYQIAGLPPTPICNPGRAALEASLKPAATNELFFVADGHGSHVFAATVREHEANVKKWRQFESERAAAAAATSPVAPTPVVPQSGQAPIAVTTTLNGTAGAKSGQ